MITKEQYCKQILREFADDLDIKVSDINSGHIYQSSTLAVAMEYLGMLSDEEKQYSTTRGGIFITCIDEENKDVSILSVREFIDLLPE